MVVVVIVTAQYQHMMEMMDDFMLIFLFKLNFIQLCIFVFVLYFKPNSSHVVKAKKHVISIPLAYQVSDNNSLLHFFVFLWFYFVLSQHSYIVYLNDL